LQTIWKKQKNKTSKCWIYWWKTENWASGVLCFMICKISNFNMWTTKHLAQASYTELTLTDSTTIPNHFNINHQQIYRSLLKMPQVYSAIFYRLMMSFNVISYVSNNASHICCYRAKRSCFQHWVLRIFRTRGGKKKICMFQFFL
jgi:hypothetical protein